MKYSKELEGMCCIKTGIRHEAAPIPQEGNWDKVTQISQINGFSHGIGACAPQQGACKLTLNVKGGIIQEALIETIGCSGMTQSAAIASEVLPGKTILEALNTDLVCDAINVAMREIFLQIVYGRTQSAFSNDGLVVGAGLDDLKYSRSQVGTMYSSLEKGPRYLELESGYITKLGLDKNDEIIGYEFINLGQLMTELKAHWEKGEKVIDYDHIFSKLTKVYGRYTDAVRFVDPRPEASAKIENRAEYNELVKSVEMKIAQINEAEKTARDEERKAGKKEEKKKGVSKPLSTSFEGYDLRIDRILATLKKYGMNSLDDAAAVCDKWGKKDNVIATVSTQADAFDNARWAYIVGTAIALKQREKLEAEGKKLTAIEAAKLIGEGLQSFCIPGSVADTRTIGTGHGTLAAKLLDPETKCFAFLAGHESFAAAQGAINLAKKANLSRPKDNPLRVILNGLGKDAAYRIARICGFTYVETDYNYATGELKITNEIRYSQGTSGDIRCYGADDVNEGVAIMDHEKVDISITGNSTNPTRFQHPVAAIYKKKCIDENLRSYYSVASGGGTGRTLHPDNVAAGPASYGLTDTMGRMHCDAQFAGSSSVAAHVDMMGFIGLGNNPIVGATVACAVDATI